MEGVLLPHRLPMAQVMQVGHFARRINAWSLMGPPAIGHHQVFLGFPRRTGELVPELRPESLDPLTSLNATHEDTPIVLL